MKVTREDYFRIKRVLEKLGFRERKREEAKEDHLGYKLVPPRKSLEPYTQVSLEFKANGLRVIVWPAFFIKDYEPKEKGSAHVLIVENGREIKYCSPDIRRATSDGFVKKILYRARIAQLRAENRPRCEICNEFMHIGYGRHFGSHVWICVNPEKHKYKIVSQWDTGIPANAQKYIDKFRKVKQKYNARLRKAGKPTGQSRRIRKKWKRVKI